MNKLGILIKYNFLKLISIFQGKKTNRKSTSVGLGLLILAGLGILAVYSAQAYSMYYGFSQIGISQVCLFHASLIAFCVLIILSVMRAGTSNTNRDLDLLLSLPIKKPLIVISKSLGLYFLDFAISFLAIMPFSVLFMVFEGFNLTLLICSIILVILLPLFSVGLSYIFQFIISFIFNKTKFANLLKAIVIVAIFAAAFVLMITKTSVYGTLAPDNLNAFFESDFISNMLMQFMLGQSFSAILFVLAFTIITFAIGVILYSVTLGKSTSGYKSKSTELKFTNRKSVFFSMYKKELKAYSESIAFISNTIIGPILILVLAIAITIFGGYEAIVAKLGIPIIPEIFLGIIIIFMLFASAMTAISCSTISLEGNNFWILKSSPIKERQILIPKALLQLTIILPAILVASIIFLISLKLTIFQFIFLLGTVIIFNVALAFGGLLINLTFPKMQWESDTAVIKQSLATLLTMLFGIILAIIPVILYLLISDFIITAIITVGIYLILAITTIILINTIAAKLLQKIN